MSSAARFLLSVGTLYAVMLAVPVATGILVSAALPEEDAAALERMLRHETPVLVVGAVALLFVCGAIVKWFLGAYANAARALAEQTRVIQAANADLRLPLDGPRELAELAAAVNGLAGAYRGLQRDAEARAAEARARLEEERNRLAALMSELTLGVVLCSAEGRILLYNERARGLFAPADAPSRQALVGLGRSLFSLLDRRQIAHAMDKLRRSLERGERLPGTHFVAATQGGRLLKVQAAPFLDAEGRLGGMVLALDDVTAQLERETQRRSLLQTFAARIRAPAANMRAAAENLATYPEMEGARRDQFVRIVVDESRALSLTINEALSEHADALKAALTLEDMRAADLMEFACQRIAAVLGIGADLGEVDEESWVRVDSFALVQSMVYLAARLQDEYAVRRVELHARPAGRFVEFDIAWSGAIVASDALPLWELQPMQVGDDQSPLTLRDVLEQHGGEAWYQRGGVGGVSAARFRLLVPGGEPGLVPAIPVRVAESRPEYYDFDLFSHTDVGAALHDSALETLSYTVFDTETTGLEPSAGDEIISIGAVRIVNGRLLRNEVFEQLVDPRRALNPESARVHGIDAAALAGQPVIAEVLPAFHRFCEDTVLVAHNAAFDMRFLELKRTSSGVSFDQPVLDTLLLSAAVHPSLEDHSIEAIAARLGVSVVGRHTALGDALLTGEILLKLLPLLAERGIFTLGQALDASRDTFHARLQY